MGSPGVKAVSQVQAWAAAQDSVFDVTVAGLVGDLTLRYVTEDYNAPRNLLLVARSAVFTSIDRITVEPDGTDRWSPMTQTCASTVCCASAIWACGWCSAISVTGLPQSSPVLDAQPA